MWAGAETLDFKCAGKPVESFKKGRETANIWFTYIFLWLCEMCFVKRRRGVYGLTRVEIVETERNEQIWDVLELGQYMSKLKDLKMFFV